MASVKEQLKPIILKSLRVTDLTPEDLRDDQPLMGGELEIDSIDILQLVLEIERHFGIKLVQAGFDQEALREYQRFGGDHRIESGGGELISTIGGAIPSFSSHDLSKCIHLALFIVRIFIPVERSSPDN